VTATAAEQAFFSGVLAAGYDALYADRNVDAEVGTVLERVAGWLGGGNIDVLDLGCGTGRHIEALTARGYRTTGIDMSAALVDIARRRNPGARVEVGDLRSFALGQRFDLAIALFGVFDYLPTIHDVRAGLRSTAIHLSQGGVLYMVVSRAGAMQPVAQYREAKLDDGNVLLRWTKPGPYNADSGIVRLTYEFVVVDSTRDNVLATHQETHVMRSWTATELRLFLEEAGFRCESLNVQEATFNVLARRVG
jgi:SAM-dependent methyltransferase